MSSVLLGTAWAVTVTSACAIALTAIALRDGVLRLRPEPRRCPSCGRRLQPRTCSSCTHGHGG